MPVAFRHRGVRLAVCCALLGGILPVAACAGVGQAPRHEGLRLVAAERTWGAIAEVLGGPDVRVTSIVSSPAVDPHSYEPETADARAVADADVVIVNGLGYDTWASQLVAADGRSGQWRLDVGAVLGLPTGTNPHRWYDPGDVVRVADVLAGQFASLDPRHAGAYRRRLATFLHVDLHAYFGAIMQLRRRFAGVPVGASESIAAPIAAAAKLRIVTPPGLLRAVSDGSDVAAGDMATAEHQIRTHAIRVWILNSQNSTPNVRILTDLARSERIPVVTMTETPDPAGSGWAAWQTRQLMALSGALAGGAR